MFIIKFENQDCWIAPWEGDPGRTLNRKSARQFKTEDSAKKCADRMMKRFTYRKMSLIVEPA